MGGEASGTGMARSLGMGFGEGLGDGVVILSGLRNIWQILAYLGVECM